MTDSTAQAVFNIQRIYLQDMSLEQPNSPQIFLEATPPSAELHVQIDARPLNDSLFEALLTLTLTTSIDKKVALIVELKQAGIFEIQNFPPEEVSPLLYVTCPSILFGYARANLADLVTRAGFPPVHLSEVNFHALYEHRMAENTPSAQPTEELAS